MMRLFVAILLVLFVSCTKESQQTASRRKVSPPVNLQDYQGEWWLKPDPCPQGSQLYFDSIIAACVTFPVTSLTNLSAVWDNDHGLVSIPGILAWLQNVGFEGPVSLLVPHRRGDAYVSQGQVVSVVHRVFSSDDEVQQHRLPIKDGVRDGVEDYGELQVVYKHGKIESFVVEGKELLTQDPIVAPGIQGGRIVDGALAGTWTFETPAAFVDKAVLKFSGPGSYVATRYISGEPSQITVKDWLLVENGHGHRFNKGHYIGSTETPRNCAYKRSSPHGPCNDRGMTGNFVDGRPDGPFVTEYKGQTWKTSPKNGTGRWAAPAFHSGLGEIALGGVCVGQLEKGIWKNGKCQADERTVMTFEFQDRYLNGEVIYEAVSPDDSEETEERHHARYFGSWHGPYKRVVRDQSGNAYMTETGQWKRGVRSGVWTQIDSKESRKQKTTFMNDKLSGVTTTKGSLTEECKSLTRQTMQCTITDGSGRIEQGVVKENGGFDFGLRSVSRRDTLFRLERRWSRNGPWKMADGSTKVFKAGY